MKKSIFTTLLVVCMSTYAAVEVKAQDDCSILMGAAKILYEQGKWDIVKMECESYLSQCGYNAEMQQMLNECNRQLQGSSAPAPAGTDEEEELVLTFGDPTPSYTPQPTGKTGKSTNGSGAAKTSKSQPAPAYAPAPTPAANGGFGLELLEEDDSAPAPAYTPQPAPVTPAPSTGLSLEPEEEELPIYTPEPEPQPVYTPEPEPVYTEPVYSEPVYTPEPEPEPVYTAPVYSEPIYTPEPEPEPVEVFVPEQEVVYTPEAVTVVEEETIKAPESYKEPEPEPVYVPVPVDTPKKEIVFTVSQAELEFTETGGVERIQVTSDEGWKVTESPSWVSVQRTGNMLTIQVARNERFSAREGDIVLTNDNYEERRVVVVQDRNSDYLTLSAQLIDDSEGDGGRYTIKVNSNKSWRVGSLPEWCIAEPNGDNLVIRLASNMSGANRQAQIEVSVPQSALSAQIITVKQVPIHDYISVSPNIITSSGKSSIATVKVETDLSDFNIEGLPGWCTIKQKDGTSFVIEIADNSGGAEREAQCRVVIAGGKSDRLVIRQAERLNYIMVTPKIITASKRGGTITVNVKSSGAWRVVNLPEWCQVTAQTDNSFTLNIDDNKTGAPRQVAFSVSTGGVRESIEVKQE